MINRLIDDKVKVEDVDINDNKVKNLFEYEGKDILMIVDKMGKAWSRGKDIATVLEYGNTRDALIRYVDDKYKKQYKELTSGIATSENKIDGKTIFINKTGIFQLVTRSKKPKAIEFLEWITEDVIPQLLEYGTYTMKSANTELAKLTKDFYVDNDITDYLNMQVFYLAYIGEYDGQHLLKFGVSGNYPRRELEEHRKQFDNYNVIKIWPTIANYLVEDKVRTEMNSKKVLIRQIIKKKNKTELIALNGVFTLDKCIKTIDKIVKCTKSKYEEDTEKIINQLKMENAKLIQEIKMMKE